MNILGIHKAIDKKANKEFESKVPEIIKDFLRFQVEHKARAFISNTYQDNPQYPPNALIDFVCSTNRLNWRIMKDDDIKELETKINEDANREPKKGSA